MISMGANDWNFKFSKGVGRHPIADGSSWKFNMPFALQPYGNTINYLSTAKFDKLQLSQLLSMTFRVVISPDVKFEYGYPINPGLRPANTRFYLQKGLILNNNANSRWWSNPVSCDLIDAGSGITLSVGLNPSEWSNIYGHMGNYSEGTIKGFITAVARAGRIGITFGGGSFFGHGVWVSQGSATFVMQEYKVE